MRRLLASLALAPIGLCPMAAQAGPLPPAGSEFNYFITPPTATNFPTPIQLTWTDNTNCWFGAVVTMTVGDWSSTKEYDIVATLDPTTDAIHGHLQNTVSIVGSDGGFWSVSLLPNYTVDALTCDTYGWGTEGFSFIGAGQDSVPEPTSILLTLPLLSLLLRRK